MVTRKAPAKKKPVKVVAEESVEDVASDIVPEDVAEVEPEVVEVVVPIKNGDKLLPRNKSRYKSMNI